MTDIIWLLSDIDVDISYLAIKYLAYIKPLFYHILLKLYDPSAPVIRVTS